MTVRLSPAPLALATAMAACLAAAPAGASDFASLAAQERTLAEAVDRYCTTGANTIPNAVEYCREEQSKAALASIRLRQAAAKRIAALPPQERAAKEIILNGIVKRCFDESTKPAARTDFESARLCEMRQLGASGLY